MQDKDPANKKEPQHKKLFLLFEESIKFPNKINIEKRSDYTAALKAIELGSDCSQDHPKKRMGKNEKKGEKQFQITKNRVISAIMIASLIFIAFLLINKNEPIKSILPTTITLAD